MAIAGDGNVTPKLSRKETKIQKSLCKEVQRMWKMKCMIIPVTIGATVIVTKGLKDKFGSGTRKTIDRFTTKDSYTWNITHNTESTAV